MASFVEPLHPPGPPTDASPTICSVRVGIVDVGANTLRLLVATRDQRGRAAPIREDRRQLGLGEELERTGGTIGEEKLVAVLRDATGCDVRVLDADEEGSLAWLGAVAAAVDLPETVAVCDVGGGSAQVVVGATGQGPTWSRSVDIGSLRLT